MSFTETLITGFTLGLAGSLHCVGMCGAIVTALSFSAQKQRFSQATLTTLFYNTGRIVTYTLLGILAGVIGSLGDSFGVLSVLRVIAAILLIMTGLYLTEWWKGLLLLERAGQSLWQSLKPLTSKLSPSSSKLHAIMSGLLWGLIPCGLVYSALGIATAQGSISSSVGFMLAFGGGTFAPMVLMGVGFTRITQWLRKVWLKYLLALGLIAFGGWNLYNVVAHGVHSSDTEQSKQHNSHHHHE